MKVYVAIADYAGAKVVVGTFTTEQLAWAFITDHESKMAIFSVKAFDLIGDNNE